MPKEVLVSRKHLRVIIAVVFCTALISVAAPGQQPDNEGFKDPALFTRMPVFYGDSVQEIQFDAYNFKVQGGKEQRVEGHMFRYLYRWDEARGARPSTLQVMRNYQNAAQRIGGKVLFENDEYLTLLVAKGGKETWVSVEPYGSQLTLVIVERETMKQDVVANADALKGGLAEAGHVEVPGIFFDTGKSEVKPESKPALDEIAKLIKADASLRVYVVGHTDSVGTLEANMKLSEARAAAVAKTLVTDYGISAGRLKGMGVGPLSPVASNDTAEGKARNRRVELVKQ